MVMLRNIMEGRYSFTSPEWDDITGKHDIGESLVMFCTNYIRILMY